MLIRLKEVRGINEKYKTSYGLQYDAWELIIQLPDWEEYDSEEEAKRISENLSLIHISSPRDSTSCRLPCCA